MEVWDALERCTSKGNESLVGGNTELLPERVSTKVISQCGAEVLEVTVCDRSELEVINGSQSRLHQYSKTRRQP